MTKSLQSRLPGSADLAAELTLRFGAERLHGRVYWPAATTAPPLILLLGGARDGETFSASLSSVAGAVVLSFSRPPSEPSDVVVEVATLGWAAEHAFDLGADPQRLLIGGTYDSAGRAARVAIVARDQGWPAIRRQVLVYPVFDGACPIPLEVAGTPPTTIMTRTPADPDLTRYTARLRAGGVEVDELRVANSALPSDAELDVLVRFLRLGATNDRSTARRSSSMRTSTETPSSPTAVATRGRSRRGGRA
jgi:acetyl esterase/lipase